MAVPWWWQRMMAPCSRHKSTMVKKNGVKHAVMCVNEAGSVQDSDMVEAAELESQKLLN